MLNLPTKFEAIVEDVNREDGVILTAYSRLLEQMFLLIKWVGIPFVLYLLFEISRW